MDMDKPPPSYNETFPERQVPNSTPTSGGYESGHVLPDCNTSTELLQEIDTVLNFVSNIDIVTIPVLSQLLPSENEDFSQTGSNSRTKKYIVLDQANGAEIFQVLDISGRGGPNIRGLTLTLSSQKSVLHCGYLYSPTFSSLELSAPSGTPVGVFQRDGFGIGLLCPCICLCCCFPMATASIKNPATGEPLLVGDAYLFPRIIDMSRPAHLGGFKIGSINVGEIHMNQTVKVKFEDCASPNEKLLVTGLAVGMMDFEQFHKARGGYAYHGVGSSNQL